MSMTPGDVTAEIRETLSALKAAGISVASSSKNTKFILKQVGLDDEFDAVSDGTNIKKSKPDPEIFLKAAEYIALKPQDCLMVEDAIAGIEAAKHDEMKAAGIGDAAFCEKTDYSISTFADLKDIVL